MIIRKAEKGDITALAVIFRQLHEHHVRIAPDSHRMPFTQYFELEMRSLLSDENVCILVLEDKGEMQAYAAVRIFDRDSVDRTPARICYIDHFAVDESCRRKGIGTELFEEVKRMAKDNECSCIQLGAAACNPEALGFYESLGMTPRTIKMELKL